MDLSSNPITDISLLTQTNFPNLKSLDITDTWVRDFSAIDEEYWTRKFFEDDLNNRLYICSNALENWDYNLNNEGEPLGKIDLNTFELINPDGWTASDRERIEEQLEKPTCAPVFNFETTGESTSVTLEIDADTDLSASRGTPVTYVYRYGKSGGRWPHTSTDTATPRWTGGFTNPPSGEDTTPNYQGVIEKDGSGEYTAEITGLDPSAVYHFQVFGFSLSAGTNRFIYPPGSEVKCWSTSDQSVVVCSDPPLTGIKPTTSTPDIMTQTLADAPEEKQIEGTLADAPEEKPIAEKPIEDITPRLPPGLVVTQIDFAKGMFSVQNTTQYRFYVEMRIYSEDHRDRWFRVSERALIAIEDAETLTFSLTPVETDDPSIIHLNSELLLRMNQNQPLKLSAEKFCIKLIRVIPVDIASNIHDGLSEVNDPQWTPPGDVIFRQYDAAWDEKLKGMRRDHLVYRRLPLDGQLSDSWGVEASVSAAPPVSRNQLRVVLSQFRSAPTESGVLVEWTTASERANAGFYVLRSRNRKSGFVRVSPRLIVGTGTATEGQAYSWRDTTAAANVPYYYRLEEVSLYGERRALGTVRLRGFISSAGKLLWKWADVKTFEKR